MTRWKTVIVCVGAGVLTVGGALLITREPASICGAVIANDVDPTKRLPIADVEVTVAGGPQVRPVRSDASGYFAIPLSWRIRRATRIMLHFHHPDYEPADLPDVGEDSYISHA